MDRHHRFSPPAAATDADASAATAAAASSCDSSARASIAERRAATCGFKAERINSPRFRTTASPLDSPAHCITIPAGISPTALLDSPVLLPNSQSSPTTGTFPTSFFGYENGALNGDMDPVGSAESSFRLKHHGDHDSQQRLSNLDNQGYSVGSQALGLAPMDFEFPAEFSKDATANSCSGNLVHDMKPVNSMAVPNFIYAQICHSVPSRNQTSVQRRPLNGKSDAIHHPIEDQKSTAGTGGGGGGGGGRTSEDGYSWRKYGQKQVKGSEYPRSYYKCTNPSCQVKKKIERSHDGQITEIIYKNAHNHPKPNPVRRGGQLESSPTADEMPEIDEGNGGNCVKIERGLVVVKNEGSGRKDNNEPGTDWRAADGLERTSSTSVVTELSDLLSTNQGKSAGTFESVETPELSSAVASHEDDDDTQGSISVGGYTDEEESDSKRRKTESCMGEGNMTSRAVREPRVVVQIESEIDILDDGYRWRKYGQKVVKGNPNPRSYYKCTSTGCSVRKHVERASHNLKYVITTYEGKHNHEVPAARNSSSLTSNSNCLSQASANTQPGLSLPRGGASGAKPETQMQDFVHGFDRRSLFNNNSDYLRGGFSGNFVNEMKLDVPSIYSMKFPAIQSSIPYGGTYSFNSTRTPIHHPGSMGSLVPQFPLQLSSSLHTLGGVDLSNNVPSGMGQVVQHFITGQQLIRPKQELKDDNLYNASAASSIVNQVNASQPQVYQRIMGNFPS